MNKNDVMGSPIFVILPPKETLFAKRAQRFTHLAHSLANKEALLFFAHFCNVQQKLVEKFKDFAIPLCRFSAPVAPPLDRSKLLTLGLYESMVDDFLKHLADPKLLSQGFLATRYDALNRMQQQKDQWRIWGYNILNHILPPQQLTEHIFITGALQVMYSLAASQFDAQNLTAQQNNLCPACSGTHFATLIINVKPQGIIKVCSCLYCGTLWHTPSTQCTFCGTTQRTSTHSSEHTPDSILWETCEVCGSYCKQLNHHQNPSLDVFADDMSTSSIDFLHKTPFHFKRRNFNPFLAEEGKQFVLHEE